MRDLQRGWFRSALLGVLSLTLITGGTVVWAQEDGVPRGGFDAPMEPSEARWHLQQLVNDADQNEIGWALEGALKYLEKYEAARDWIRTAESRLEAAEYVLRQRNLELAGTDLAEGVDRDDSGPQSVQSAFGSAGMLVGLACSVAEYVVQSYYDGGYDVWCDSGAVPGSSEAMCTHVGNQLSAALNVLSDPFCGGG